jgi:putative two-component system response regulator
MSDTRLRRPQVLVIDDDESIRALLLVAEDAIVGGRLALSDAPDLILLDVQMPYMNGYELAAALKLDPMTRRIPVVFLTIDENVAEQAGRLGIAGYLNKYPAPALGAHDQRTRHIVPHQAIVRRRDDEGVDGA